MYDITSLKGMREYVELSNFEKRFLTNCRAKRKSIVHKPCTLLGKVVYHGDTG